MVRTPDRAVKRWLFAFTGVVAVLIMFGGFVRLTRSGLSIVEWEPVTGVIPPIGDDAWNDVFAEYQQSPEFRQVNHAMSMAEFKRIFLIEWFHRLVARLAGFTYAIPLGLFVWRRRIPLREIGVYVAMGSLFLFQALAGWLMVASGLEDRPAVDHLNLTVHLLLAFALLALALWTALGHRSGVAAPSRTTRWSPSAAMTAMFLCSVVVQVAYGGLTAGLKAGYISDTWPAMSGSLIPPNLFRTVADFIDSPLTVTFIHRWFAFIVATLAIGTGAIVMRNRADRESRTLAKVLVGSIGLQIILGITTVMTSVEEGVALAHQATAIGIFAVALALLHRLRSVDGASNLGPTVDGVVAVSDADETPRELLPR